jgi:hypothetical protein
MRVLCTCLPAYGHFHPMVPLARALATADHEIAFATAEEFRSYIERTGFSTFPAGLGMAMQMREARVRYPGFHRENMSSPPPTWSSPSPGSGPASVLRLGSRTYDRSSPGGYRSLSSMTTGNWRGPSPPPKPVSPTSTTRGRVVSPGPLPSNSCCDGMDVGGTGHRPRPFGGMFRYLYLDLFPPSLAWPDVREFNVAQPMRPVPFDTVAHDQLPPWAGGLGRRPVVYITQGTTFNRDAAVFGPLLEALRDEAVDIIVTLGEDGDPGALGPQPENVRVERYLAQSLLFPLCDLVVTHGGGNHACRPDPRHPPAHRAPRRGSVPHRGAGLCRRRRPLGQQV